MVEYTEAIIYSTNLPNYSINPIKTLTCLLVEYMMVTASNHTFCVYDEVTSSSPPVRAWGGKERL